MISVKRLGSSLLRYLSSLRRVDTILMSPLVDEKSFGFVFRWPVRYVILVVSVAIWNSGEPESVSCSLNFCWASLIAWSFTHGWGGAHGSKTRSSSSSGSSVAVAAPPPTSTGLSSTASTGAASSAGSSGGVESMRGDRRAGRDATHSCGAWDPHRGTARPENAVRDDSAAPQGVVKAGEFIVWCCPHELELEPRAQVGNAASDEDEQAEMLAGAQREGLTPSMTMSTSLHVLPPFELEPELH